MANSDFDNFVRRQQAKKQKAEEFDVGLELDEWRGFLDELYLDVEKFMATYLADGQATISYQKIELNEEFSGPYEARQMSLSIGPSVIVFKPIGTMLIGSKGRVDVQGPYGSARLVLVNRNIRQPRQLIQVSISTPGIPAVSADTQSSEPIEWVWKLVTPAPSMRLIDLSEESFFEMVLSIADA